MRTVSAIAIAVTIAIVAGCGAGPVDHPAEEAAVRASIEQLIEAEHARDIGAIMAFWTEDAVLHPPGAPEIRGRAAIRAMYEEVFDGDMLKDFSAEPLQVEVSMAGDIAYEIGTNEAIFPTPGGDMRNPGKYLTVWKKVDDQWLIAAISFSNNAPAPVPVER
jgi:uncharacterized protein (TIGR02246 family)